MKKETGVVLVITLLFLQILTLYCLFAMQTALIATKHNQLLIYSHTAFIEAENALKQIEGSLLEKIVSCKIKPTPPSVLMTKSQSYWQSLCKGTLRKFQYNFAIEEISASNNAPFNYDKTTSLVRISLRGQFYHNQVNLQKTIIFNGLGREYIWHRW